MHGVEMRQSNVHECFWLTRPNDIKQTGLFYGGLASCTRFPSHTYALCPAGN